MAPDLNTLPPSRPESGAATPLPIRMAQPIDTHTEASSPPVSGVPLSPSHSLAATAAMNAGIHNEDSRHQSGSSVRREAERARRRSSIRMNLNLNDPTIPAPGELQMSPSLRTRVPNFPSPRHDRAPSLGELHQELENEQEAQTNRLLGLIRQENANIINLTNAQTTPAAGASAVDDSTPTSERSMSLPQSATQQSFASHARSRSPLPRPRHSLSRQSSYHEHSRGNSRSPALRPAVFGPGSRSESNEWLSGSLGSRDESAFYQAETSMLTRENQMLKIRIRELERQLTELSPASPNPHAPATASNLVTSPPIEAQETQVPESQPLPPAASVPTGAAT